MRDGAKAGSILGRASSVIPEDRSRSHLGKCRSATGTSEMS